MTNSRDLELFSEFVQALYTLCPLVDFPHLAASRLAKILSGKGYSHTGVDFQQLQLNTNATMFPASELEQLFEHLISVHPLVIHYAHTRSSKAVKISDLKSESELYRLEISYWQILQPMEIESRACIVFQHSSIPKNNTKSSAGTDSVTTTTGMCLCICQSQHKFTDRDRLLLNLIRPHLIQAYANAIVLTQTHDRLAQLDRLLEQANALIVNFDGQVQLFTTGATALLQKYYDWRPASQLPETLWRWLKFQILFVTANGKVISSIAPLQVEQETTRLSIRIVPDVAESQLILILAEQPIQKLSIESLQLIGLTQKEAHVLILLTRNNSNIEISQALNCSLHTVKKHLENIYDKLHVHHRTAAVVAALNQLGLINITGVNPRLLP